MPPKACCEKWSIKSFVCRPCTQSLDRCPALGRGNSWQLITLETAPGWYEERTSDHGNTNMGKRARSKSFGKHKPKPIEPECARKRGQGSLLGSHGAAKAIN